MSFYSLNLVSHKSEVIAKRLQKLLFTNDKINMDIERLKFPIGEYIPDREQNEVLLQEWTEHKLFPTRVEGLIRNIVHIEKLNWKYRPLFLMVQTGNSPYGDSHMNSVIRF